MIRQNQQGRKNSAKYIEDKNFPEKPMLLVFGVKIAAEKSNENEDYRWQSEQILLEHEKKSQCSSHQRNVNLAIDHIFFQ